MKDKVPYLEMTWNCESLVSSVRGDKIHAQRWEAFDLMHCHTQTLVSPSNPVSKASCSCKRDVFMESSILYNTLDH